MLEDSGRKIILDKKFTSDIQEIKYINRLFTRLVAINIHFEKVDFRYCIFDSAYLRNCTFDSCDFTGCKFLDSNLVGSSFTGCVFDYATFERTHIDNDILESGCPSRENLKLRFSRSLRMNYKEIGDAKSVNRAISIELQATESHLKKSWLSTESYYREKYKWLSRVKSFFEWSEFKILDFIWGNGESALKLVRFTFILMLIITIIDVLKTGDINQVNVYVETFIKSPQILLGVEKPLFNEKWYITIIYLIQVILIGFLISIIIKRFNRR